MHEAELKLSPTDLVTWHMFFHSTLRLSAPEEPAQST